MLAYIVLFLVVLYLILDKSGLLAEILDTFRAPTDEAGMGHPELNEKTVTDPETERRLEVFEEFIEQLEPSQDEEEE